MDVHLTWVLVDLEAGLAAKLGRPIAYGIFDSKGSGLPTAERYAEAEREYKSCNDTNAGQQPRNGRHRYSGRSFGMHHTATEWSRTG